MVNTGCTCAQGRYDPTLRWLGCWCTPLRWLAWLTHLTTVMTIMHYITLAEAAHESTVPWSPCANKIWLAATMWQAVILFLLR